MSLSPRPATTLPALPPDALLDDDDGTPPSVELHPSVKPGTQFKRYDSRVVEGLTLASCLLVTLTLFVLAR
jgi:hypothetical protein